MGTTRIFGKQETAAKIKTITAATTLTSIDSGKVIILNAAAGKVVTLPSVAVAGFKLKVIVGAAFATTNFTVVSPTAKIQGGAVVNSVFVAAADENTILGLYMPDRNILILFFDFFHCSTLEGNDKIYSIILKELEDGWNFSKITLKKVDVKEIRMKRMIEKLKSSSTRRIKDLAANIKAYESNLKSYSKTIFEQIQGRNIAMTEYEALVKIDKTFDEAIVKSIEEVKSLPFVKSINLTGEGIVIKYGKLSFSKVYDTTQDEDESTTRKGKVKCYLGEFTLKIKGDVIEITNKHPVVRESGDEYHHMHINDDHMCLGDYAVKVKELMGSFKYKDLAYLMYSYLKSYNPNDKHISFELFYKLREKEGKFDSDGKPLRVERQTKIVGEHK